MYIEMSDLCFSVNTSVIMMVALMIALVKIAKYYSDVRKHETGKVNKKY